MGDSSEKLLPVDIDMNDFSPVAYYDKHMDCIRVITHDRSLTEHRLNEMLTVYECNHRGRFDPIYVGFAIKGVRHLFNQVGIPLEGVYRLTELIDRIVSYQPGSVASELLKMTFSAQSVGDLTVQLEGHEGNSEAA